MKSEFQVFAQATGNRQQATGKNIITDAYRKSFSQMPSKITVKAALNAAFKDYLVYGKGTPNHADNCRNGTTNKRLPIDAAELQQDTPCTGWAVSNRNRSRNTSANLLR